MSIYDKLDFSKYFEAPEFKTLLEGIAEISACIYRKNWAEANAGNISINVSEEIDTINLRYSIRPPLPYAKWYLVSKSGSRYRELAKQAHPHLVLIAVEGRQQLVFPNDARPTSEWVSHLSIQQGFSRNKVIIHTHPTEIIALSNLPDYQDPQLGNKLFDILPELYIYLPEGIAFANYAPPGSERLRDESLKVLANKKVIIWEKHGILAFGKDLDEAFDYLEIVNKVAGIYLKLR